MRFLSNFLVCCAIIGLCRDAQRALGESKDFKVLLFVGQLRRAGSIGKLVAGSKQTTIGP
ncbi:MAG TPA: hypothetical protein VFT15_17770 [Chitinophagaceae bacterium]|nr:hypothetical protein [Chitinophagaceae bacterium]